jgi:micrococcal nuclease
MLLIFLLTLEYLQGGLSLRWPRGDTGQYHVVGDVVANDWQAPVGLPQPIATDPAGEFAAQRSGLTGTGDALSGRFGLCHSGGGTNCVVDGDTFWFGGQKIRIADIDTPETHPPRCAEEARLGAAATRRLHGLLNAGPFTLEGVDRNTDRYGRALRIVTRDGESLGGVLVDEGLARWYGSGRQPWC